MKRVLIIGGKHFETQDDFNKMVDKFYHLERNLAECGYVPINPARFYENGYPLIQIIAITKKLILSSDAVVLMDDWEYHADSFHEVHISIMAKKPFLSKMNYSNTRKWELKKKQFELKLNTYV